MKHLFTAAAMLFSMTAFAQVGINNTSPKATLDITAKTTDGSKPEGLIIPQLSGSNIHTATAAGVYGANQKGLIIYATSADSSPISATANITTAGYYYFDGTNWQKVMTGSVANSDLTTGVGGIYKGSGSLSGNTTVTQGASTLAFTSTATNGFSVDGTTLSVDAANHRVGIGTANPASRLVLENDNNTDDYDDFMINTYGTTATPSILLTQSRGTKATPANLQNGDIMGGFNFRGRANGTSSTMSTINSIYRGNGTTVLSDLNFSTSGTTKMRIDENGNVGIGTNAPQKILHVNANNNSIRFENLPSLSTGSSSTGLVIDANGDIYKNNTVSTEGQILRIGVNGATYTSGSEAGLRFNTDNDSTEMGLAANGASNFINTITGSSLLENVTLAAGLGTTSRTTDRIILQPGVYKIQVRLGGTFASQNNANQINIKCVVNNNEYSFTSFSNPGTALGTYYFDDYINITGSAQSVDFTIYPTNDFSTISRGAVGTAQIYRSLILIQRLR
jgi:hypothetical protein